MLVPLSFLAFAASLLSSTTVVTALSASEIPADTPISSLLSSANAHLAKGETNDALTYYDVAISRDPNNYLTFFKRGATYLSLGRSAQAEADFDKVLSIRPGFEGALLQRAKIHARNGEWELARKDYMAAGKTGGEELNELQEAQGAAALALEAEKHGNWEECVTQAGVAIMVASKTLSLRQARAHCRFERGEMQEGISDLMHVLQMQPGLTDPHLKISSILYYAMGDSERGQAQIRKCLHSDPDSKPCKKLYRTFKATEKQLARVKKSMEKRQFSSAAKVLTPSADGSEPGLIQEIKSDVEALRTDGKIPANAPDELLGRVVDLSCEAYSEMGSKKAVEACEAALAHNENSKWGLLAKAQKHFDAEDYDACIAVLQRADEHHPGDNTIKSRLQKAQVALKRSKEKDYYKILGVPNDADERQIKSAYRKSVQKNHPDKAHVNGVTKEQAEKKMAAINEAYEVLSDPELRARFDRGDDPNSHDRQSHPFQQGNPFQGGGHPFFQQHSGGGGGQKFHFQFGGGGFPGFQ